MSGFFGKIGAIFLSKLAPMLVPAKMMSGSKRSLSAYISLCERSFASIDSKPARSNIARAGPVRIHKRLSPRALSAFATGTIALAPPGSFAVTRMRLDELIFVRDNFLERQDEKIDIIRRIGILANI